MKLQNIKSKHFKTLRSKIQISLKFKGKNSNSKTLECKIQTLKNFRGCNMQFAFYLIFSLVFLLVFNILIVKKTIFDKYKIFFFFLRNDKYKIKMLG